MTLSVSKQRSDTLQKLCGEPLDTLVIGGGIVGSSVARDAAMRGLKTGLVEQHDFAFGTSSRSSRLLHGGIRYLAQGRIGLVREASLEKTVIHEIAPHLAQPLAFIFPTYAGTDWPLWQMRIGVKFYDLLCSGRNLGKSSGMSKADTLRALPQLNPAKLTGAVRYFDGLTNDARLVLDTLRSAQAHGAALLNYCQFQNATRENNLWRCPVLDTITGQVHEIRARTIVNASGPWAANLPHSRVKLRLTKGIHLVLNRNRIPAADAVVLTKGKRILFVIPWGERTILGTTDTDYNGSLDRVRPDSNDISYLLGVANETFPAAALTAKDVISSWAGLRPLLANPNGTASDISRAHQIKNPEPGWWDVAGGKLTTCRLMAEQTMDRLISSAGFSGADCRTASEPLLSKTDAFSGILPAAFNRAAVEHYCHDEWTLHLDDLMIRRTSWHYYHADARNKALQAADWMSEILGWSAAERQNEIARYAGAVD
jgi:glycerol-3-phosphate dehydrogenase